MAGGGVMGLVVDSRSVNVLMYALTLLSRPYEYRSPCPHLVLPSAGCIVSRGVANV